jgi:hypothetical protein
MHFTQLNPPECPGFLSVFILLAYKTQSLTSGFQVCNGLEQLRKQQRSDLNGPIDNNNIPEVNFPKDESSALGPRAHTWLSTKFSSHLAQGGRESKSRQPGYCYVGRKWGCSGLGGGRRGPPGFPDDSQLHRGLFFHGVGWGSCGAGAPWCDRNSISSIVRGPCWKLAFSTVVPLTFRARQFLVWGMSVYYRMFTSIPVPDFHLLNTSTHYTQPLVTTTKNVSRLWHIVSLGTKINLVENLCSKPTTWF